METLVKRQKAKVGVAGSFFNQLMSNNSSVPVVGNGATKLHYSDRTCYEVLDVSEDGKTVLMESLDAEWDKTKEGGQGHQNWILKPTGCFLTVQWRHNAWRVKSQSVVFTDKYIKDVLNSEECTAADYQKPMVDGKMVVMDEVTRLQTKWHPIRILFGVKDYYYDWEF